MKQRVFTSLMVIAAGLVSALLATMPIIGQSAAPKAPRKATKAAYTPPKLPWGDPDLQGLWPGDRPDRSPSTARSEGWRASRGH